MEFENVIRNRESIRSFSTRNVEKELLEKILESGRLAPTAKDLQPVKIYVITNNKKLDKCTKCRYNAPVSLLVCGNKEEAWINDREDYPALEVDSAIVATHMMLEATNVGVDSIWVRYFDTNALREEFDIPENIVRVVLLNLRYRDENTYKPNPLHTRRKAIEEIVEYK